jgi:hypothetical protein
MGLGSLKDKIIRKLALRWARGKVNSLRGKDKETGMGKVLKFLDGWKLVIGVVIIFGAKVYDQLANGHSGDIIGSVVSVLGWAPDVTSMPEIAAAAGGLAAVIGLAHKVWKAQQQLQAGAAASDLLGTQGYIIKQIDEVGGRVVVKGTRTSEAGSDVVVKGGEKITVKWGPEMDKP